MPKAVAFDRLAFLGKSFFETKRLQIKVLALFRLLLKSKKKCGTGIFLNKRIAFLPNESDAAEFLMLSATRHKTLCGFSNR